MFRAISLFVLSLVTMMATVPMNEARSEDKYEILNVEEINTTRTDFAPWLSEDGLTIYWTGTEVEGDSREFWIWTAHRKDVDSLFADKKKLFRGHSPVLTADGLEIIFRAPDAEAFSVATRKKITDPFGRPRLIPELRLQRLDPAPRSLSPDGLTLYFDRKNRDGKDYNTWVVTRPDRKGKWQRATPLVVDSDDVPNGSKFVQVFSTPDGLHLICLSVLASTKNKPVPRLAVLSRPKPEGAFTTYTPIVLTSKLTPEPICLAPRYVRATKELFFSSNAFFLDLETARKRKDDIWVIKNFIPPYESKSRK